MVAWASALLHRTFCIGPFASDSTNATFLPSSIRVMGMNSRLLILALQTAPLVLLPVPAWGQVLFSEDYASGATQATALVPSVVQSGGNSATPVFEIESFIVNPNFNNGSFSGPNLLTFDPSAANPQGVPEGFQAIDFDGPPHPDDPGNYNEITASGNWWTDHPTTFFHQNASIALSPQLATRNKIYVIDYSVASNVAGSGTENVGARIGLFDEKDQGVYFGHNFNTKPTGQRFMRANQLNVHRLNAAGENVHIETGDGTFSSGHRNLSYGQTSTITPPTLDFSDFKIRGEDDTGALSHFFANQAVVRFHDLERGNMNIEWFVGESIPEDPLDNTSTPFGGDVGTRPEKDGWHNFPVLQNIYDLSGTEKVPLGDFQKLRISLWGLTFAESGYTVANFDEINHKNGPDRFTNNHQIGFGRIAVREYHAGDVNRDASVTSADIVASGMLTQINTLGDRVWQDGDVTGDKNVTVGDALAGVLPYVSGVAPSGPELVYNGANGNLQIQTNGQSLAGFGLLAAPGATFSLASFTNPNPVRELP
jgi:hypothetical protein